MHLNWKILIFQANSLLFRLRWWHGSRKPSKVLQMVNVNALISTCVCFWVNGSSHGHGSQCKDEQADTCSSYNRIKCAGCNKTGTIPLNSAPYAKPSFEKNVASQFRCTKCKGHGYIDTRRNTSDVGTKGQVQYWYDSHNLDSFGPWGQFLL